MNVSPSVAVTARLALCRCSAIKLQRTTTNSTAKPHCLTTHHMYCTIDYVHLPYVNGIATGAARRTLFCLRLSGTPMSSLDCAFVLHRLQEYLAGRHPDWKPAEAALASVVAAYAAPNPEVTCFPINPQTHASAAYVAGSSALVVSMIIPARDSVLETTELLETILCFLPLEDIARARRVCKQWSECIETSPVLKQLMHLAPHGPKKLERAEYNGLWTTPITLNPLLTRTVILPSNYFPEAAALAPVSPQEVAARTPLFENLLQAEVAPASPLPSSPREPSSRPNTLLDQDERPILDGFLNLEGPPLPPGKTVKTTPGQNTWKHMLISSPPVPEFQLRQAKGKQALMLQTPGGARMADLLDALEGLKFDFPESEWPKEPTGQEVYDFEIFLPLYLENGEKAESSNGDTGVWRALKTRLRCRITESDAEADQEYREFFDAVMTEG